MGMYFYILSIICVPFFACTPIFLIQLKYTTVKINLSLAISKTIIQFVAVKCYLQEVSSLQL